MTKHLASDDATTVLRSTYWSCSDQVTGGKRVAASDPRLWPRPARKALGLCVGRLAQYESLAKASRSAMARQAHKIAHLLIGFAGDDQPTTERVSEQVWTLVGRRQVSAA